MGSMSCFPVQRLFKLPACSPVTLLVSYSSLRRSLGPKPRSTMVAGWRRSFSSQPRGLLLDLPQYSQMRQTLAGRKGDLEVLESAGLFILDMENLKVNTTVRDLNQMYENFTERKSAGYTEIKKLKTAGVLRTGKYTSVHDELILSSFNDLAGRFEADQKTFEAELFSHVGRREKSVLLQRNLVGFYLLQELEDWSQRLPVEVVTRLGTLLSSGGFSRQEDEAILAWVAEHGLTGWAELAAELGRNYKKSGSGVRDRYRILADRRENKRMGNFTMEENRFIIREVIS